MSEVNLLEKELLLDDKQVEILAFAISSQDIKKYIKENKNEYIHWLIQDFVIQAYEKYGDKIIEKLKEKISILNKMLNLQIDISSMLKTK
jgi:predicted PilT family ATPase